MFFRRNKNSVKITRDQLESSVITAMYILSDGMEWHVAGKEEESHPLVMESPEAIAEAVVNQIFWKPSPGSEDSSSSSASS